MKKFLKFKIGNFYKNFYNYNESLTIFLFHEVTDTPSEYQKRDGVFHTKKEFINTIDWIDKNYDFINPNKFINSKKKFALITFDDGFNGNFDFAIPQLVKRKIPSISFLNFRPIIKQEPNIVTTVQFLRNNNSNFKKFMKMNNLRYDVHLDITPKLFKSFILNNKKIELNRILIDQGKIVEYDTLNNFSNNEYVYFSNHMYEHWNCNKLSDNEVEYYYEKNFLELKKFNNFINFFAFPFGFYRKDFLKNIKKDNQPKKLFTFYNGVNDNFFNQVLDRLYVKNLNEVGNTLYYNILRSYIKKKSQYII